MALPEDVDRDSIIEWEVLGNTYRMDVGLAATIEALLSEMIVRAEESGEDAIGEGYDGCLTCIMRSLIMATASQVILGMENGLVEMKA